MKKVSAKHLALIGLLLTNLFWAANAVVARYVVDDIPPFSLAFGRWLLAFLILMPFALPHMRAALPVIKARWQVILVLGILGIAVYNTVLYLAAHATTAINITLVGSTMPLITLVVSYLMLNIKPTFYQWLGIGISLLGIVIIVTSGDFQALLSLSFNKGDILMLLIACVWSVYSVILRKYPIDLPATVLLFVVLAAGMPLLIVLAIYENTLLSSSAVYFDNVPIFIFIAIFPSLLSYGFWAYGVKHLGPNIAAVSCYLMPVMAACLAVPLLGEALYSHHIIGGVLILLGLYLSTLFKQGKNSL